MDNSKQYCQRNYVLKITFDPPHKTTYRYDLHTKFEILKS